MTLTTAQAVRHIAEVIARHQAELAERYPRQAPEHEQLIGCICTRGPAVCVRCQRLAQEMSNRSTTITVRPGGHTTMSIRAQVIKLVAEQVAQASINQHHQHTHTLYATPDGRVYWSTEPSANTWDVLAGTTTPVERVYRTGCGSSHCDCDGCGRGVDPETWAGSCDDIGDLADELASQVDAIELGYFEDETPAQESAVKPYHCFDCGKEHGIFEDCDPRTRE